jgi:hypothetical protein
MIEIIMGVIRSVLYLRWVWEGVTLHEPSAERYILCSLRDVNGRVCFGDGAWIREGRLGPWMVLLR